MAPKLSDKGFAQGRQPPKWPTRLTEQQKQALRGIANENSWALEQTSVLLGRGTVDEIMNRTAEEKSEENTGPWFCTVCDVFVTPKSGKCPHCEKENIVKQTETPHPMKGASAEVRSYTGSLRPVSAPVHLAPDTMQIKVAYNRHFGSPGSSDLMAYVAHRHPGYSIIDGNDKCAGITTLIIRKADEVELPLTDAADVPAGMRRHSPAPYEGTTYGEPVEGTGKIGQAAPPPAEPPPADGATPDLTDPTQMGLEDPTPEAPEEEMSLEEAVELAPEVINTIVEKVEQGETLLHGEEMAPVEEPGEMSPGVPGAATPPMQEGAVPVNGSYHAALVAEIAKEANVKLSAGALHRITWFLSRKPGTSKQADGEPVQVPRLVDELFQLAQSDMGVARMIDGIQVRYLIKRNDILRQLTEEDQKKILTYAIRNDSRILKKLTKTVQNKGIDLGKEPEPPAATAPGKGESEEQEEHMEPQSAKEAQKLKIPTVEKGLDDAVKLDKMEDRAEDKELQTRAPHIGYHVDKVWHSGAYVFFRITWDPDTKESEKQTDAALRQDLKSYVQRFTSQRDMIDYGYPGRLQYQMVDQEAGMAEVFFRTIKPGAAPLTIVDAD